MGQKYSASPTYSHSLVPLSSKLSSQVELCKLNTEPNGRGRREGPLGRYPFKGGWIVGVPGSPFIFRQAPAAFVGSWLSAGKNAHNFKTPSSQDVAVALVTPPKNVSFLLRDEQGASAAPEKLDNGCAVLCSVLCCESYTIRRFVLCTDYCRVNCSPWPCMGPTQRCFANHLDPLVRSSFLHPEAAQPC